MMGESFRESSGINPWRRQSVSATPCTVFDLLSDLFGCCIREQCPYPDPDVVTLGPGKTTEGQVTKGKTLFLFLFLRDER